MLTRIFILLVFIFTGILNADSPPKPLPPQTGNSGKYLTTNGTYPSWATLSPPSFPLQSTILGSNTSPTIRPGTDTDSGLYSTGDGNVSITANGTQRLSVNQAGTSVIGDLNITGNLTATNFPVTGSPYGFAGFDGVGTFGNLNGWNLNDGYGLATYHQYDLVGSRTVHNMEIAFEIADDVSADANSINIDSHYDRANTGKSITGHFSGLNISHRHEGSGHIGSMSGLQVYTDTGSNGGTLDDYEGLGVYTNVSGGSVFNVRGLNLDVDGATGTGTNNTTVLNMGTRDHFDYDFNFISANNANTGAIGHDFRFFQMGNDGTVANNSATGFFFHNGTIAENLNGMTVFANANVGTAGHNNQSTGFEFNIGNGHTNNASPTGFRFYNGSDVLGNANTSGVDVNNQAAGYRFIGLNVNNNGDFSEEINGMRFNSNGTSRTATGVDINMQGEVLEDVRGLRINLNNLVTASPTAKVQSIETQGGVISIQSTNKIIDGNPVDIGNGLSVTTVVDDEVTADGFMQFFQSNLLIHNPINPGPYGLGMNGLGVVHQIAIDSGITTPLFRALIVGASMPPQSSGGELTEFVNIEMVGLKSFGGTLINPNKYGIAFRSFLGQDFCMGSTNCWSIFVDDEAAENFFKGNVVIGGTTGHGITHAKLTIVDSHYKQTQSVAPSASVSPNAGTDATCIIEGTDQTGMVTLGTGTDTWSSGPQCSISFHLEFDAPPHCVFSPTNGPAAMASMSVYIQPPSYQGFDLNFVNAETSPSTYQWSYHCE